MVLGFPALRGMSLTRADRHLGAALRPSREWRTCSPLLFGEVDHRLDDIKQWIINIDARGPSRATSGRPATAAALLRRARRADARVSSSSSPTSIRTNWEVYVRTDDGVVTIDQLSQGMNSIIAWVGTLLQRMYDIYPNVPEPAARARVRADRRARRAPPPGVAADPARPHPQPLPEGAVPGNLALAAAWLPDLVTRRAVRRSARAAARRTQMANDHLVATIAVADIDPHGLRADQILTSPLFGLMTSRSPKVLEADAERYDDELFIKQRSPDA